MELTVIYAAFPDNMPAIWLPFCSSAAWFSLKKNGSKILQTGRQKTFPRPQRAFWSNIRDRSSLSGKSLSIFRYRILPYRQMYLSPSKIPGRRNETTAANENTKELTWWLILIRAAIFPLWAWQMEPLNRWDGWKREAGGLESGAMSGNYYYYAHFHSYIKDWKRGEPVKRQEMCWDIWVTLDMDRKGRRGSSRCIFIWGSIFRLRKVASSPSILTGCFGTGKAKSLSYIY